MIDEKFPTETGNADIIHKKALPESRITMFRLEELFEFMSQAVDSIAVKERKDSKIKVCLCILRVTFWGQGIWKDMERNCSWSLYSGDREKLDDIILRRVLWDAQKDGEIVTEHLMWDTQSGGEVMRKGIEGRHKTDMPTEPSITIRNQYIAYPHADSVIQLVKELDAEIGNGFILHENECERGEWNDLRVMRLYNWGQVHMTWCPEKTNGRVEQSIKKFVSGVNILIEKECEDIFSMCLNYDVTPERYRDWTNKR